MQVDAQNKFTGKSFEIRPTGVANVDILLPAEWGRTYPKYRSKYLDSEAGGRALQLEKGDHEYFRFHSWVTDNRPLW